MTRTKRTRSNKQVSSTSTKRDSVPANKEDASTSNSKDASVPTKNDASTMTVPCGVDAGIQTENYWDDDRLRKYRRMKRKILEFIAKHKSAQFSVDRANQKVQQLQKEKKLLLRKTMNGDTPMEGDDDDDIDGEEEEEDYEIAEEDEDIGAIINKNRRGRNRYSKRQPEVPRDENGNVKFPFQVASVNVLSLGKVVYDRPSFHCDRYIWPVGYCVERTYMSMVDPTSQTKYTCKVEDAGDGPLFTIRAADVPDEELSARTATGVWASVVKRAHEVRQKMTLSNAVSGPEYYGFSHPIIVELIEKLENAEKCSNYKFRARRE